VAKDRQKEAGQIGRLAFVSPQAWYHLRLLLVNIAGWMDWTGICTVDSVQHKILRKVVDYSSMTVDGTKLYNTFNIHVKTKRHSAYWCGPGIYI